MTTRDDIDRVWTESSAPPDMSGHRRLDTNVVRMAKRLDTIEAMLRTMASTPTADDESDCLGCVHRHVPNDMEPCDRCRTLSFQPSQWVAK